MRPRVAGSRLTLVLVLVLASFAFPAHAQVVRTWVSTTGIDNPSCTRSSPCRTFGAAIAAVNAEGEVAVLDSGGYGAFTVTKAVTVIAPTGIHAAIAPTAGTAVTVSAGASDNVRLVNLQLTSQGATLGIWYQSGASLSIERSAIDGFSTGISAWAGILRLVDTLVAGGSAQGVILEPSSGTASLIASGSRFERNGIGLITSNNTRAVVSDSIFSGNGTGVVVGSSGVGAELSLENCNLSLNSVYGAYVSGSGGGGTPVATLRLSGNTILNNATGVAIVSSSAGDAIAYTRGNNTLHGNLQDISGIFTNLPGR